MTIQGIQIDGQGTFNDVTENAGVVSTAVFAGSASNSGTVSLSAEFGGDSANHGEVTQVAVFAGNAVNTGTVAVAEFRDTAMNAGTVSTSATFADTSVNTGTVVTAFFADSSVNDGGTVTGNAVFADTSENSGTVQGDAQVAATATNSGSVGGSVSEYVPPNNNPIAGTVLSTETNYITINGGQYANGTYDVIADGNGGSSNGNYQYAPSGTELYNDGSVYHYVSDGNGSYTQYYRSGYVLSTESNYITINNIQVSPGTYDLIADGNGGSTLGNYSYTAAGTYQVNGLWYTFDGNGGGSYATGISPFDNNANTYYRYDGAGGRAGVQAGATPNNTVYYFTSFTIGGYVYYNNGVLAVNMALDISGYQYITDGAGQIIGIVDIDPYN